MDRGLSRPGATLTGAASLVVLQPNPSRREATFTNDSINIIYLTKGVVAALNSSLRLNSNGGFLRIGPDEFGRVWRGPISAIATGANSNLIWTEDV